MYFQTLFFGTPGEFLLDDPAEFGALQSAIDSILSDSFTSGAQPTIELDGSITAGVPGPLSQAFEVVGAVLNRHTVHVEFKFNVLVEFNYSPSALLFSVITNASHGSNGITCDVLEVRLYTEVFGGDMSYGLEFRYRYFENGIEEMSPVVSPSGTFQQLSLNTITLPLTGAENISAVLDVDFNTDDTPDRNIHFAVDMGLGVSEGDFTIESPALGATPNPAGSGNTAFIFDGRNGSNPSSSRFTMLEYTELAPPVSPTTPVSAFFDLVLNNKIEPVFVIDAPFNPSIHFAIDLNLPMVKSVQAVFDIVYHIEDVNRVHAAFDIVYSLFEENTQFITARPVAIIDGIEVLLESANIVFSDGQYAWVCDMVLLSTDDYQRFVSNKPFSISLLGEVYNFIVDGKSLSRGGLVDRSASVRGISKIARLVEPRAVPLAIDLSSAPQTTQDLHALLLGDLFADSTWEILHWVIPAGRIGSTAQTQLRLLQQVAAAAGAVVVSDPSGHIRIRYDFPVSVPHYSAATAAQVYNDLDDNFSISEQIALPEFTDKLRVLDASPFDAGAGGDSMEFKQDEGSPTRGDLKVYPRPWRESLRVTHTLFANTAFLLKTGMPFEPMSEVVEVIGGKANVSKPIWQIDSITFIDVNLGAYTFEHYTNEIVFDTKSESLIRVNYQSRYIAYRVFAYIDAQMQIVAYEDEASQVNSAAVDVLVERGAGSRRGDDIVDGLIGNTAVALQRGRNELDKQASGLQDVDVSTRFRVGVRTGQIAEFYDSVLGAVWFGKIVGISHNVSRAGQGHFELTTNLSVKRPTDIYAS